MHQVHAVKAANLQSLKAVRVDLAASFTLAEFSSDSRSKACPARTDSLEADDRWHGDAISDHSAPLSSRCPSLFY